MLFTWMLESSLVLIVAWVATRLMSGARATDRHTVWLMALAGSVLLALAPLVPDRPSLLSFGVMRFATSETLNEPAQAWPKISMFTVWLLVAALLLLRLARAHLRLARNARKMQPAQLLGRDVFLSTQGPFTMGLWRPRIVLPSSAPTWSETHLSAVLVHEEAHVARKDGVTQLFADVFAALSWPNPLAWIARQQLALERELAADAIVLARGTLPSDYAALLLRHARPHTMLAVAMASPSSLTLRIDRILALRTPACTRWLVTFSLLSLGATVAVLGCSAEEAQGSLDPALIKQVIQDNRGRVRACYEAELETNNTLSGTIMSQFVIDVDGTVKSSIIKETSMNNRAVEDCIASAIAKMSFPEPKGGGVIFVNYPFAFQAGHEAAAR